MAVNLHGGDSLLPYQSLPDEDYESLHSQDSPSMRDHKGNQSWKEEEDFIVDLTTKMDAYSFSQSEEDSLDSSSSSSVSDKSEMSWPSWCFADSPEYKLWSPLSSKEGSGLSSPTGSISFDPPYNELNMKLEKHGRNEEPESNTNKRRLEAATGLSISKGSTIVDEQIRALQLKMKSNGESRDQSLQHSESDTRNGSIRQNQSQKLAAAKGCENNGKMGCPGGFSCSSCWPVASRQQQLQRDHQTCPGYRAVLLEGFKSNAKAGCTGTGVFLPPSTHTTTTTYHARKKAGCSTVLIPARVVQALKQHFDQMGVTSDHRLPPLHDVLVHNKDGMLYSLQKLHLQRVPTNRPKEMSLPQEWTY